MPKRLTPEQRLKRLHDNTIEHISRVIRNYASEVSFIIEEIKLRDKK